MEQFRKMIPSTRAKSARSLSPDKTRCQYNTTCNNHQHQQNPDLTDLTSHPALNPPPLLHHLHHPPAAPSTDPSPGHSRPPSISLSVAHPQTYPPPTPAPLPTLCTNRRRAFSFSSPFNPYSPTPVYPTAIQTLTMLIQLGILIVLGIFLSEMKKTTAQFHTASNNSTGSYFRIGLYGGGLGNVNRPFYVNSLNGSALPGLLPSYWT